MSERLSSYHTLVELSYEKAIQFLIKKYGTVKDDYYIEKVYESFLKGERKTLVKGGYSRAKDGLYCHHILENKYHNIGDRWYIQKYQYPFEYHKKDRLVYCDLIEHMILHAIIAQETKGKYGVAGYAVFIEPMVLEWYVGGLEPKPEWMRICKKKANVTVEQLKQIFNHLFKKVNISFLGMQSSNRILEYEKLNIKIKENKIRAEQFEERKIQIEKDRLREEREYELERPIRMAECRQAQKRELQIFRQKFPNVFAIGIRPNSARQKLLSKLFEYKYNNLQFSKERLKHEKINTLRDDLIEELERTLRKGVY